MQTDVEIVDDRRVDTGGADEQLRSNSQHGSHVILACKFLNQNNDASSLPRPMALLRNVFWGLYMLD